MQMLTINHIVIHTAEVVDGYPPCHSLQLPSLSVVSQATFQGQYLPAHFLML